MAKFVMGQKLILQALLNAQGETEATVEDSKVANATRVPLTDVRDYFHTLDHMELVDLTWTENGLCASVNRMGRLALGLYRPLPSQPAPPQPEPARSRSRTGREQALVIGISDYPPPIRPLPAVANDVREMAKILGSAQGQFPAQNVRCLADGEATQRAVLEAIDATFSGVQADDAVFAYLAGHGAVVGGDYYFIAHDTTIKDIATNGVPLAKIKAAYDSSPSQRAFLWLDFCHSGGIIPRDLGGEPDDRDLMSRTLEVVQGQGKVIIAACSPSQSAWESTAVGHGFFTDALLKGLKGQARHDGEVTVNSLYDYIDRQMGNDRQRPMMFGTMTGRVVLTHLA